MVGMGKLLKQAQKMQAQMQQVQEDLASETVEGAAGGGVVTAKVTGTQELISIKIDPDVVNPDDVEMLEDLILSAVNQAVEASRTMAESKMKGISAGLNIPGMNLPGM